MNERMCNGFFVISRHEGKTLVERVRYGERDQTEHSRTYHPTTSSRKRLSESLNKGIHTGAILPPNIHIHEDGVSLFYYTLD